jgi:hypothetical protein
MKQQILAWLKSPRNYNEGLELYKQYGYNKMLKNTFSRGETAYNMQSLVYELAKLVDLTEAEANMLPRLSKAEKAPVKEVPFIPVANVPKQPDIDDLLLMLAGEFKVSVDDLFGGNGPAMISDEQQAAIEKLTPAYREIPELQKKVIRFREQYPFLKDANCPDELKVMVADMFTAYDNYKEAYKLLSPENPEADNLEIAKAVVENYLDNREMWKELDYYKENNELLGEHPLFARIKRQNELKAVPDVELMQLRNNARGNVTKTRKKLEKAKTDKVDADIAKYSASFESWTYEEFLVSTEIEARKK